MNFRKTYTTEELISYYTESLPPPNFNDFVAVASNAPFAPFPAYQNIRVNTNKQHASPPPEREQQDESSSFQLSDDDHQSDFQGVVEPNSEQPQGYFAGPQTYGYFPYFMPITAFQGYQGFQQHEQFNNMKEDNSFMMIGDDDCNDENEESFPSVVNTNEMNKGMLDSKNFHAQNINAFHGFMNVNEFNSNDIGFPSVVSQPQESEDESPSKNPIFQPKKIMMMDDQIEQSFPSVFGNNNDNDGDNDDMGDNQFPSVINSDVQSPKFAPQPIPAFMPTNVPVFLQEPVSIEVEEKSEDEQSFEEEEEEEIKEDYIAEEEVLENEFSNVFSPQLIKSTNYYCSVTPIPDFNKAIRPKRDGFASRRFWRSE